MLNYRQAPPPPALQGVVARFSQRRCVDAQHHIPAFGLPARLDRFIEFYLGEPVRVAVDAQAPVAAPDIVLVAPHTRPGKRLHLVGDVDTFTVHFEPTGLHRLFGLSLQSLDNLAVPANQLVGPGVLELRDRLARAHGFEARVQAASGWLLERLASSRPADALDRAVAAWRLEDGVAPVATWACRLGWSERHLHRRFLERTGLSPALHGRLLRFQALMAAHARAPQAALTTLALEAGYFDQSHCIRDCRAFTGEAPRAFLSQWPDLGRA
ncbi:AraC family transcriptional regulator [Roseateles sp. BYS87W]|uniref:Helix-turn-helix domain-containing protein n=1 Tax=Pelomonas baiyunensis TaxID=3299026 RepID=A0ABW7GWS0_9BURK